MNSRVATVDDLDGIARVLASAFSEDPLWSWAFPEQNDLERWWRFFAGSALRYPSTWVVDDFAAVSVWIPPGETELTHSEELEMEPLLQDLAGDRADEVIKLVEAFESNHPKDPPHYYLSLLGTHRDHRGKGLGMALLAENLARIDDEGLPAYLESSNSANVPLYESHGFGQIGEFERPDGKVRAATMWRVPRALT